MSFDLEKGWETETTDLLSLWRGNRFKIEGSYCVLEATVGIGLIYVWRMWQNGNPRFITDVLMTRLTSLFGEFWLHHSGCKIRLRIGDVMVWIYEPIEINLKGPVHATECPIWSSINMRTNQLAVKVLPTMGQFQILATFQCFSTGLKSQPQVKPFEMISTARLILCSRSFELVMWIYSLDVDFKLN